MKTARVFRNGRSLAVRIPRAWLGDAAEVELERVGGTIRLRPRRTSLGEVAAGFRRSPVEIGRLPQSRTRPHSLSGP